MRPPSARHRVVPLRGAPCDARGATSVLPRKVKRCRPCSPLYAVPPMRAATAASKCGSAEMRYTSGRCQVCSAEIAAAAARGGAATVTCGTAVVGASAVAVCGVEALRSCIRRRRARAGGGTGHTGLKGGRAAERRGCGSPGTLTGPWAEPVPARCSTDGSGGPDRAGADARQCCRSLRRSRRGGGRAGGSGRR